MRTRILIVLSALLLLSASVYAAVRVYDLAGGDTLEVTCLGDELNIIQSDREAALHCIEWTPTPTSTFTPTPTATFSPTATATYTPSPTPTDTPTPSAPGVYPISTTQSLVVIEDRRDGPLSEFVFAAPEGWTVHVDCEVPPLPEGVAPPPCLVWVQEGE